ncbi:MAG: hypothetical protein M0Z54_03630 [Thermaerobacter sp.]|nr:hypothetical protein [Thermaerobacter sp.]
MSRRATPRVPLGARLRFSVGAALGILGLGAMGTSVFPVVWSALIGGFLLLLLGLAVSIGTIAHRTPAESKSHP